VDTKGFTLIELVIVMVILIIIAAGVTAIRWPSAGIELNIQAHQIASDIRYTQSLSMSMNKRYRIYFYTNDYSIKDNNDVSIRHPATHTTNNIALGTGISFTKPPTPNCIAFDGRGTPCDCTTGNVLGDSIVSLAAGAETDNITILQTTGYVATS
jgi:prepilin-type N-terminal cleavage/methylation domain-containing protein